MTTLDDRVAGVMQRVSEREARLAVEHKYLVVITHRNGKRGAIRTKSRHRALQAYMAARMLLNDFAQEEENFLVRIWCDGVEYFNNKDRSMRGYITGSNRPVPTDRHLP